MAWDRRQESNTLGGKISASKDPSHKNRSRIRRTSVWTPARKLIDAFTSLPNRAAVARRYQRLSLRRATLLRSRRSAYARGGVMGDASKYSGLVRKSTVRQATAHSIERNAAQLSGDPPPVIRHVRGALRQRDSGKRREQQ